MCRSRLTLLRAACAAFFLLAVAPLSAGDTNPPLDAGAARQVLRWLPASTQSAIVMGPYRYAVPPMPQPIGFRNGLPLYAPGASDHRLPFENSAFQGTTSFYELHPQLLEACRSSDVTLSVFAFRALNTEFAIPGGTELDGCQILVFAHDLAPEVRGLFRDATTWERFPVLTLPKMVRRLEGVGQPPMVTLAPAAAPQRPERKHFAALLSPRMLVAANSEGYLRELLVAATKSPVPEPVFPLPDRFSTDHVRLWGYRRLTTGPAAGATGGFRLDPQATALSVEFDATGRALMLQLHSPSSRSAEALDQMIERLMDLPAHAQRRDGGAVLKLADVDGRQWMVVLFMLGIAVFV